MATLGEFLGEGSATTKLLLHLEGNSSDSSGNSNNGTDTSITYSLANGKFGQGAGFNGSSSKIVIPSASVPATDITVSFWFKHNGNFSGTNGTEAFLSKQTSAVANGFVISGYSSPNGITIQNRNSSGSKVGEISYNSDTLINNLWHNLIFTINNSTRKLNFFIDGNSVATEVTLSSSVQYTTNVLTVGQSEDTFWGKLTGSIDEVIISNYAWSAAKIAKYYSYSKGRFGTL